jgi:hypothetical protein
MARDTVISTSLWQVNQARSPHRYNQSCQIFFLELACIHVEIAWTINNPLLIAFYTPWLLVHNQVGKLGVIVELVVF